MKARVANISEPSFEDIPVWLLPDTGVGFEIVNDVNIEVIEGLGVVESREHCRNARPGNTFHQHSGGLEPGHFPTNTPTTRLLCRLPQTIDFLDCKA